MYFQNALIRNINTKTTKQLRQQWFCEVSQVVHVASDVSAKSDVLSCSAL